MNTVSVILKVLLLSAVLSIGIKYLAPNFNIPPTATSALVAVFLPTLVMAGVLGWRSWKQMNAEETQIEK
jgi:hypothetical protein